MKLLRCAIAISLCALLVSGCSWSDNYSWTNLPKAQSKPKIIDLSDQEIKKLSARELCNFWFQNDDPRLKQTLSAKNISCDDVSLQCLDQGFMQPSKGFNSCVAKHEADSKFALKKSSNPAFGYCYDSGFKEGTSAMAICMSSWQERQQMENMMQIQQQNNEQVRKERAWQHVQESLKQNSSPTYTNCTRLGSSVNCTTY